MAAFRKALEELQHGGPERAKRVLVSLSDPSEEPIRGGNDESCLRGLAGEQIVRVGKAAV